MKLIEDMLAALPTEVQSGPYDGMIVAPAHFERVQSAVPDQTAMTFAGVKLVANPAVPEGFAVITRNGEPCGVINFKDGTATCTRPSRDPLAQH